MSRVLTDNIQTATGVTRTVRDKELFQGEVEGKKRGRVSRQSRGRKASSAREGGKRWAVGRARDSSLANRSEGFVGGRRLKAYEGLARTGEASTVGSSATTTKLTLSPSK
jgi:hypothetical protein